MKYEIYSLGLFVQIIIKVTKSILDNLKYNIVMQKIHNKQWDLYWSVLNIL